MCIFLNKQFFGYKKQRCLAKEVLTVGAYLLESESQALRRGCDNQRAGSEITLFSGCVVLGLTWQSLSPRKAVPAL